ncbi:MAG: PD-(D/E)XK nuclease family protein [Myxococcales bacterium]
MNELLTSAGADARLVRALDWLAPRSRALIVGATQEAAADLAREAAQRVKASFGWHRFTLGRLAAVVAADALAARGLSPLSPLGIEAVCARVVHQLGHAGELGKFQAVAQQPGLGRALAQTLQEVRLAGARPAGDLGRLLVAYEAELSRAQLADRAEVFRLALEAPEHPLLSLPAVLVDLPVQAAVEARFLSRLRGDVLATAPAGDARAVDRLSRALGVAPVPVEEPRETSLSRVQQRLFVEGAEALPPLGEDVEILSAPGESRECVEIARRVLAEAARGTPFDRMAVLLRAPGQYRALLEEAFARAGIPAYFASGTLRPDPAGRAFLALLACAAEGLSARSFAEYLSLGEVPDAVEGGPPPAPASGDRWVPPDSELIPARAETEPEQEPQSPADPDAPVAAGALRAPWRWEGLIVDAAVIGGRDRWVKRLSGLENSLRRELEGHAEEEALSARLRRELDDLAALRAFALPLLDALAALPREASWGAWLEPLTALATRALREPNRVLSVLHELHPMDPVGPISLSEVRLVLGRRLTERPESPSGQRHGKVYVARIAAARGLSFDVAFVPGLAEKVFPQKVIEDPLLRDSERAGLSGLDSSEDRVAQERLALRLAAGAARRKLVLSWPRIDLSQGRARVPSFYGLEVLRAAEGVLPAFADLARRAEEATGARSDWPAPADPAQAIDDAEHDLSLLKHAFGLSAAEARGIGAYLLTANAHLARALRVGARRWIRRWTGADGLVGPSAEALAALQKHQLTARSYSPTALQNYAACPYKFVLQALHRLSPREVPEAIDEIDPLQRGGLIHKIQFTFLRAEPLPVADLPAAQQRLEAVIDRLAAEAKEDLAPAIERVWDDCITGIRIDLRRWLELLAEERAWTPWRFELAFGLTDLVEERDPHSRREPVVLDDGITLRGSIDLVEQAADGSLRATDYKTGKVWADPGVVIGGGDTLQPALYALALEKRFPEHRVVGGRLYYCTYVGEFTERDVPLETAARGSVAVLARTISDAVAQGFLPAAPRDDRECTRCDYQPVCGPNEWQRVKRKPADGLVPLRKLREMP